MVCDMTTHPARNNIVANPEGLSAQVVLESFGQWVNDRIGEAMRIEMDLAFRDRPFDVEIPYLKQAPLLGDNLGEPIVARKNGFTQAIERLAAGIAGERPPAVAPWRRLWRG